jgi:acetyl esterase
MKTPIQLRLLRWYYHRYLEVDYRSMTAVEMRAALEAKSSKAKQLVNGPIIPVSKTTDHDIPSRAGQIPIRIYFPNEKKQLPILTYFHGGGFVIYGLDSHDHVCRRLCRDNEAIVVAVDYRLAPEHKFPAAPEDAYDALLWVSGNASSIGGNPNKLAVVGDSAGGNLAAVVSQMAKDQNGPTIAAQVLVYPVVDARMGHPSIKENGKGNILTEDLMRWFLDHYKNSDADILNPYMSPLLAKDFSNLPPALVQVAGLDPLRDEGKDYAEHLKAAGNQVQLTTYQGLTHSFFSMPGLSKRCVAAYNEIRGFLSGRFE